MRPVVIGAGPAGLTAAHELGRHGIEGIVLEREKHVGGLARTEVYRGFRFDIGGHRFYTSIPEIEERWTELLGDRLLQVNRRSRIYYRGRLFDYPLKAPNVLSNLGIVETLACMTSWGCAQVRPRPVASFEDWVINRFGQRLYRTFFKTYTEKVWGMPCHEIGAEWAAQRIEGLDLWRAVQTACGWRSDKQIRTLIDTFRYPEQGPGMMWEAMHDTVSAMGWQVRTGCEVRALYDDAPGAMRVELGDGSNFEATHVISSMPLQLLVRALRPAPSAPVLEAAARLRYRDFITVVLILDVEELFPDQWIYVHDPGVHVGRIQNYKNWSASMVPDAGWTSLGLEYFCSRQDDLWRRSDPELLALAERELHALGLLARGRVIDGTVLRLSHAYPVYDSTHAESVKAIRGFLATAWPQVQVAGRNGMHRYDNQDHAMLSGLQAARQILGAPSDHGLDETTLRKIPLPLRK